MANYNYKFNNQNLSNFVYERDWLDKIDLSKSNMWAWGYYVFTQDNTTSIPTNIDESINWKKIDFTTFSGTTYAAIKDDGTLWTWGYNGLGACGDGTIIDRSSPVQVLTGGKWKDVNCGGKIVTAIKSDGTLWAWGNGYVGTNTNFISVSSPVLFSSDKTWKMVKSGLEHTIGITTEGYLWGWGTNDYGQVGDGTVISRSSPVQLDSFAPSQWKFVTATGKMSGAIRIDSAGFSWGYGKNGALGNGDIPRSSPTQLTGSLSWKQISFSKADQTITEDRFGLGITTDGKLYAWGDNAFGQLGRSNVNDENAPIQVGSSTNWKQVVCGASGTTTACTLALKTDDTLWGWGTPASGRLIGISGFTATSSPVQLGSFSNTKSIVADSVRAFIFNRNYSY